MTFVSDGGGSDAEAAACGGDEREGLKAVIEGQARQFLPSASARTPPVSLAFLRFGETEAKRRHHFVG